MGQLEQDATDAGIQRGWDHASYVEAYGGITRPEESEIEIPGQYMDVPTYYTAGYFEGIDQFENERMDDAFPDLSDPREPAWNGE
jgi:hypothetical protein